MGQKDLSEKILADYNDVFADIVNVLVLEGRQRIDSDDLTATAVHSQYKADDGVLHEQERDVSKYWEKQKIHMSLFGIENQTDIEKNMPFRVIGYDGAAYRQQLLQKRKPVPVITLVLHFGTKERWFRRSNGLTTVTADGLFVRIFSRICLLWLQLQRLRC